jgi:hypothetical protein
MNEKSLSALYRRLTAQPVPLALDAETLASAAEGTLADETAGVLAGSPREAAVVRMLSALRADSEALAADVARTATRETTHRRHAREERRVAAGRRHSGTMRWATAMAACLVAVVGAFSLRHSAAPAPQAQQHVVAKADRISSFGMDSDGTTRKPDELFRSDFSSNGG